MKLMGIEILKDEIVYVIKVDEILNFEECLKIGDFL